jgi:3-mercaptopyruvate sulfurtransferase SseA
VFKLEIRSGAISVALFVFLACAGYGNVSGATPPASPGQQAAASGEARRITPAELREALDKGKAILIDVRGEDSYKAGHIKGARWILFSEIADHIKELPRDKLIVTYCS